MFALFSPDFPYLDQWEFVLFLDKAYDGALSFHDLWAQHNEHRLIFPRAIMLVLAWLTHWDVRYELAVNFLLGTALFAVMLWQARLTARAAGVPASRWLPLLLSLLLFSLSQWQNWFLGWQMQELLNLLAVAGALLCLSYPEARWRHFIAALLFGVVATYSFANGMLLWLIGVPVIWLARPARLKARLSVWIAVAGVVAATYLYRYETPDYHPSLWSVFGHPIAFPLYVLKYLGQPLANYSGTAAALAGAAGLALWIALLAALRRPHGFPSPTLAPYLGLGLYALGSALLTGVARVELGTEQAMSSRYVTMANPLWAANIVLVWLALSRRRGVRPRRLPKAAAAGCASLLVLASLYGAYRWTERYHAYVPARAQLLEAHPDTTLLRRIHPEPEVILERRVILERLGLSVFRTRQ